MNANDIIIFPSDDDDSILDTYEYGLISSEDEINFSTINEDEIIVTNNPTKKVWWWKLLLVIIVFKK